MGFIAGKRPLIDELVDTKMVTCVTTSLFTETLIYRLLTEGYYRKYIAKLVDRLGESRRRVVAAFERSGIEIFHGTDRGMFLWARFPEVSDSLTLAESAQSRGLILAPGAVFRPDLQASPWMRFNVATCDDAAVQRGLDDIRQDAELQSNMTRLAG
jgi:DNA-binding transcriptional MocR family regulator